MSATPDTTLIPRPPVVAIMGHVDHGKSSLLDYVRKTNVVAGEAGGITQHLSAYEVTLPSESGTDRKITFIDTPGHQAFSDMRHRGARVADIAILIVSAEDSVKEQTIEAIETIKKSKTPFIVAINKIDRPAANPEKVKTDLLEHGVYVEGYGGDIPVALISAKAGTGVSELLDLILIAADIEELSGNPNIPATGFVIESHLDEKRGVSATLIIKNGTITKGQFVTIDTSLTTTRILEDFAGKSIDSATFSSPIQVVGFDTHPSVGTTFQVWNTKKEAEAAVTEYKQLLAEGKIETATEPHGDERIIPVIIKTDVLGTADAVEQEIRKLNDDSIFFKVIKKSVGSINESDLNLGLSDRNSMILGFGVSIDKKIKDRPECSLVTIKTFDIIYKMSEWMEEQKKTRRNVKMVEELKGSVKVLKAFSRVKTQSVLGGRLESGSVSLKDTFSIIRRDVEIGKGTFTNLQQGKSNTDRITDTGAEFGMMTDSKLEITPGDYLNVTTMIEQ